MTLFDEVKEVVKSTFSETINNFILSETQQKKEEVSSASGGLKLTEFNQKNIKKQQERISSNSNIPNFNEYKKHFNQIKKYLKYISTIPNIVNYSLIAVDNRPAKKSLRQILEKDMNKLIETLENKIIINYDENIKRYSENIKLISFDIITPEDAVSIMEKTIIKDEEDRNCQKRTDENMTIFDLATEVSNIAPEILHKSLIGLRDKTITPIAQNHSEATFAPKFTKEETRTMITLWSIFRSPLMIGTDLPQLSKENLELLTNDEIIQMNKCPNQASQTSNTWNVG